MKPFNLSIYLSIAEKRHEITVRWHVSWFIVHRLRDRVAPLDPTNPTTAADWSAAPLGSVRARTGAPSPARPPAEPACPSGRQTQRRKRRTRPTYVEENRPRGFGQLALQHAPPAPAPDQAQSGPAPRPASSLGQPRPIGRQVLAGRPYRPSIPHGRTRAVGLDLAPTRERDHRLCRRVGEAARLHHRYPAEASPGEDQTRTSRVNKELW